MTVQAGLCRTWSETGKIGFLVSWLEYPIYQLFIHLQIQNLYPFVGCMKEMVHTDPYQLSSIISLLDLAVGHGTKLTQTDRVSHSLFTFLVSLSDRVYIITEVFVLLG